MQEGQESPKSTQNRIQVALQRTDIPTIYFNGFVSTLGMGDVLFVLEQNGNAVAKLQASYSVAKTLAIKLGEIIAHLEAQIGNPVMTTDELQAALLPKGGPDR